MKSNSLLVLACLFSMPILAQTLPDEINYGPYESRYRVLETETSTAQSQLNQSRAGLAEAQKFIREKTAHIGNLESGIDEAEAEISRLRREIPELERLISQLRSEDSRIMSDLRGRQSEESHLVSRYQQAERDLRPLEAQLARKEQRLRELQVELQAQQRFEREAEARLNRELSEAQGLDRRFEQERNEQRQMEAELRNIDTRVSNVQSEISRLESGAGTLSSNLSSERAKLGALQGRVSEYESELSRLRSSGASAEEIAQVERKLNAAKNTRDNTATEIRNIESQISRNENQIRSLSSQIEDLRRNQQALPSRIAQSEARQRQLTSQRAQTQNEINRFQIEVQQARRSIEVRAQAVEGQKQDIRNDELQVNRQRQLLENVARQIEVTRNEIANLSQRSRNLNAEIARASETALSHQGAIPRLEQGIRDDQSEIAEGQRDLAQARVDERNFTAAVQRDGVKLAEVTRNRDNAQNGMSIRLNLYNKYLNEAQGLGAGQASPGTALGTKEGERLSSVLSKQNGIAVGRELGVAEAKHWGSVRGEIQGYDLGYSEGLASVEDRSRAQVEANAKAAVDAELFAQTNFRPVFFEEFVQAEFKKPFLKMAMNKSLGLKVVSFSMVERMETISSLTPSELARSQILVTPLDAGIVQMAKDVKLVEIKARRLSDPSVAFEAPTKIPLGSVNCSQVYKALAVFKAECEGSYKGTFTNNYLASAEESFSGIYQQKFTAEFNIANVSQREASFPLELANASKVGRAEGTRIGKIEIYQTTFESTYKSSYVSELEKARSKAKIDASVELSGFLKTKPLLTVASSFLSAENFRGGEEVSILGKVKNVSTVALNGPVLVRLTEVINAEKLTGEAVLNSAAALALTDLPLLKVKVSSSAKAGDKMILRGVVDLPGDLYKPARQEKFELVKVLTANPAHDLGLNFNKTPDIKGVFRRNIHFLTVTMASKVEDIREGYKLTLSPMGDAAAFVEVREAGLDTGAMSVGTAKDFRFSYVFKDAAKAKTISMELAISYAGKMIKKEVITLVPR